VLGLAGMAYALFLGVGLVEPVRGQSELAKPMLDDPLIDDELAHASLEKGSLSDKIFRILSNRAAALLLCVFVGANFVAATFLTWLTQFIYEKFSMSLSGSSTISTAWSLSSLAGALCGGVLADWRARTSKGGRIRVQSLGLILGAPFVFLAGWSGTVPMLIAALMGAGLCKGIYDANIFASLFDVVRPDDRGTAAGLMNTVGWTGGFVAPTAVGLASEHFGMSVAIGSTAVVYFLVGLLALAAAHLAECDASAKC
jgi:MFS family permease